MQILAEKYKELYKSTNYKSLFKLNKRIIKICNDLHKYYGSSVSTRNSPSSFYPNGLWKKHELSKRNNPSFPEAKREVYSYQEGALVILTKSIPEYKLKKGQIFKVKEFFSIFAISFLVGFPINPRLLVSSILKSQGIRDNLDVFRNPLYYEILEEELCKVSLFKNIRIDHRYLEPLIKNPIIMDTNQSNKVTIYNPPIGVFIHNLNIYGLLMKSHESKCYIYTEDSKRKESLELIKVDSSFVELDDKAYNKCCKILVVNYRFSATKFGKVEEKKTMRGKTFDSFEKSIVSNLATYKIINPETGSINTFLASDCALVYPELKKINTPKDRTIRVGSKVKVIDDRGMTLSRGDIVEIVSIKGTRIGKFLYRGSTQTKTTPVIVKDSKGVLYNSYLKNFKVI